MLHRNQVVFIWSDDKDSPVVNLQVSFCVIKKMSVDKQVLRDAPDMRRLVEHQALQELNQELYSEAESDLVAIAVALHETKRNMRTSYVPLLAKLFQAVRYAIARVATVYDDETDQQRDAGKQEG